MNIADKSQAEEILEDAWWEKEVGWEPARAGERRPAFIHYIKYSRKKWRWFKYTKKVEWDNEASLRNLDTWRRQIRQRMGAPKLRDPAVSYHHQEKQFLIEAYKEAYKKKAPTSKKVPINMKKVVMEFNGKFEGKMLPGSDTTRPRRTQSSLNCEAARLKEIRDLTGMKPHPRKRNPPATTDTDAGQAAEEEPEGDEGQEEDSQNDGDVEMEDDGDEGDDEEEPDTSTPAKPSKGKK